MKDRTFALLFWCRHNSARSILAESIMNQTGKDKFRTRSAGSQPSGKVHPYALDLLRNSRHDMTGLRPTTRCRSRLRKGWKRLRRCRFADGSPRIALQTRAG